MALRTNLANGTANGLAIIDAILNAVGQTRTNQQKSEVVDKVVSHFGFDPSGMTNAEKGSVFIDSVLQDLRARLRAQGEKDGKASAQAAIDAAAAAAVGLVET